jgi:hypothetical protein
MAENDPDLMMNTCPFPPSVVDGVAVIHPDRPDRYKKSMDGLMRPRRWLAQDEIDALPPDTIVWRNVEGRVVWGGIFPSREEAMQARFAGMPEAITASVAQLRRTSP